MIFKRKVKHGEKNGRKIGFPTVNLNPGKILEHFKPGVYACKVWFKKKEYTGALHLGPKINRKRPVLEIHLLTFNQNIYEHYIYFRILKKIRDPKQFSMLTALKKQIKKDIDKIKKV